MTFPTLFATLATLIALYSFTATASAQSRNMLQLGNGIAAIAEGQIITVEELRRELQPIIPRLQVESKNEADFRRRVDELNREVLQNLIDRIIIVQAAEDKGLIPQSYVDQEYDSVLQGDFSGDRGRFLEYLKAQGLTPREYREQIRKRVVVNVMRQQNRKSQSEISPERIEAFYVKNKLRFYQSESLHLRQIILMPMADENITLLRQTAKQVIAELDQGDDFGDVARKYSQDDMSRSGGDWGWLERADLRSELSDIAFDLQPGEYSQAIELNNTIFILYCQNKREEMIQPISEVRDVIEDVLVGEIARETQERWLEDLRNRALRALLPVGRRCPAAAPVVRSRHESYERVPAQQIFARFQHRPAAFGRARTWTCTLLCGERAKGCVPRLSSNPASAPPMQSPGRQRDRECRAYPAPMGPIGTMSAP